MNNGNILDLLQNASQMLPKQQRLLCTYILENPYRSCALTAQELAEFNRVGTSTVSRLMTSLGFSGYNEFKHALHDTVYQNEVQNNRLSVDMKRQLMAYKGASDQDAMMLLLNSWQKALKGFEDPEYLQVLSNAARRIAQAKRLYLFGQTAYRAVSEYFEWVLRRFVGPIVQLGETDFYLEEMQKITKDDLLILFVPCITQKNTTLTAYARMAKIPTLIFSTAAADDPHFTDVGEVIRIGKQSDIETIFSYIAVIGLLKVPIIRLKGEEARERFETLQHQLRELDILDDNISSYADYDKR